MTSVPSDYPKLPTEVLSLLGLSQDDSVYVAKGSVNKITTPEGQVWLKIVEPDENPLHRRILRGLMNLVPISMMSHAKSGKGGDTLLRQAEQADVLRAAGFNTPEAIFVNRDFLINTDCGTSLMQMVREIQGAEEQDRGRLEAKFKEVLERATHELSRLHRAGLAHGRPKMRDFAWKPKNSKPSSTWMDDSSNGEIYLFDLEERPWEVMPMHDAQGRDVILWLSDICQYDESRPHSEDMARILFQSMSDETANGLRRVVRVIAPLAPGTRWLQMSPLRNREIGGGLGAYELLKKHLAFRKGNV